MVPKFALIIVGCPRCKTAFVTMALEAGQLGQRMCNQCHTFYEFVFNMQPLTGLRQVSGVWVKGKTQCLSLKLLSGKEKIAIVESEPKQDTSSEEPPT